MNTFFNRKNYKLNDIILDKYQSRAIYCNKKNYLVVAGAGSGKTLTIVAKVDYLLKNNVNNKKILCISFTNETVNSLRNSLEKNNLSVDVKTFHRLSLDILNNKYSIASSNLLEYVTEEYFESLIYFDNSYKLLEFIDNLDYVKKIIITFINQLKTYNYNHEYILSLLRNPFLDIDQKIILSLVLKVYLVYDEELKSVNKIDFNDMINLAIEKVEGLKYFKYSYIIIDEYQDTSYSKYLLIKKLIDKFDISLMSVGDDYQSIYSFTGCNLSLFTKFKKYFKKSKIIKLKYTYRNPSDIVEISKRFVLKNRNQIHKRIKSNKYVSDSINVVYIKDLESDFNKIIEHIDNILVIGRNNKDLEILKDKEYNKNIKFLTVHSSKGLESDYVIILNVIDDYLGFPNKIKNDSILSLIFNYNYLEEERRLFYVALTRAKRRVFIFTIRGRESIFIKELIKEYKSKIKIIEMN